MDSITLVAIVTVVIFAVVFTAVLVSQKAKYNSLAAQAKKKQEDLEESDS